MRLVLWPLFYLLIVNQAVCSEQRIISIGASVSEILVALGLEEQIVARDVTSQRPAALLKAPDLGQAHHISTEALMSHRPTLVLMSSGLMNKRLHKDLNQLGIAIHIIEDGKTLEDIPKKIREIARLVHRIDRADQLINSLAPLSPPQSQQQLKLAFLYARGPSHTFMAGTETTADAMITELGHLNAFAQMQGFKPISAEALIKANPDVILIQESSQKNLDELWQTPGIQMTQAYRSRSIVFVDTLAFLGLSLKTVDELNRIRRVLHESD
jgi:iron complex transport system substrate-binding protein